MAAGLVQGRVRTLALDHSSGSLFGVTVAKTNFQLIPCSGLRPIIKLGIEDTSQPSTAAKALLRRSTNTAKPSGLPRVGKRESEQKHNSNGDAFKQAVTEMEYSTREAAEVLEDMQGKLSSTDLQLVLKYFAQEGKDCWYALEVFEWMRRVNRVEDETHKLMMSIMWDWITKAVQEECPFDFVKCLLEDMKCVGLKPDFRILHYIISVYWDKGEKTEVLAFVTGMVDSGENGQEDLNAASFLILKMAANKDQRAAMDFTKKLRASNVKLRPEAYNAGLLACLVEQEQLTLTRRQLQRYQQTGKIARLNDESLAKFNSYEAGLHSDAEDIAKWALEDEESRPTFAPVVYERLVAIYCIAGKGLEAERSMWQMKLAGREPSIEVYNTIIGICAHSNQKEAALRILESMRLSSMSPTKKTFSCLIGGFVKGGHHAHAAGAVQLMLDRGLTPEEKVIHAVLHGLQKAQLVNTYLELCRRLTREGLIENCLMYLYLDLYNLCIIRML